MAMDVFITSVCLLLALVGFLGIIVPGLPGLALVLAAAILYKVYFPDAISWWTVWVTAFFTLTAMVMDTVGTLIGAQWAGASRWGLWGAALGALIGIFWFPLGLILGPLIGAFSFELIFARRNLGRSIRSGIGAGAGVAISTVIRIAIAFSIFVLLLVDILFL